ncbi:unnamed protein product [Rhizophagus irregularis]|nr:unnamed protein product [Rhizophagus irregularis]
MLPGCSKTTLLDLLAIALEGFVAYCIQNDIFFSQLTVKESLSYTARLRLPRELSRRDKLKQVEIRILHSKILKEFAVKQKKLLLWLSTNLHLKNRNSCENFQKGGWIMNNNSSGDILKELKVSELNLIIITILIGIDGIIV